MQVQSRGITYVPCDVSTLLSGPVKVYNIFLIQYFTLLPSQYFRVYNFPATNAWVKKKKCRGKLGDCVRQAAFMTGNAKVANVPRQLAAANQSLE